MYFYDSEWRNSASFGHPLCAGSSSTCTARNGLKSSSAGQSTEVEYFITNSKHNHYTYTPYKINSLTYYKVSNNWTRTCNILSIFPLLARRNTLTHRGLGRAKWTSGFAMPFLRGTQLSQLGQSHIIFLFGDTLESFFLNLFAPRGQRKKILLWPECNFLKTKLSKYTIFLYSSEYVLFIWHRFEFILFSGE